MDAMPGKCGDGELRQILLQLARMLGPYDLENQQRVLQYSGEQIAKHLLDLSSERRARSKSAGALGLSAGAALFIILI
jgi:stage III sporulation protein AB